MPLESIYFLPHGGVIVPELEPNRTEDADLLHDTMNEVGKEIKEDGIQVIILTSPHGYVVNEQYLVYFHNVFESWEVISVADNPLQKQVERRLWQGNLQIAQILNQTFVSLGIDSTPLLLGDPNYPFKLGWGETIPLSYIADQEGPNVVIFALPMDRKEQFRAELTGIGQVIDEIVNSEIFNNVKVSLVISGDLSHRHDKDHEYGFHELSAPFDEEAMQWMKQAEGKLLDKMYEKEDDAAPCGLMGMNIIQGILDKHPDTWESTRAVYGKPTYFGMGIGTWKKRNQVTE
ncbi:MAG: hypothetical protein INQ03_21980 [Candidatus Heimdallarchaeota archaeon]|nr:hypothetical protein [Candidatus Heimdallarchaeota archaeon]